MSDNQRIKLSPMQVFALESALPPRTLMTSEWRGRTYWRREPQGYVTTIPRPTVDVLLRRGLLVKGDCEPGLIRKMQLTELGREVLSKEPVNVG